MGLEGEQCIVTWPVLVPSSTDVILAVDAIVIAVKSGTP